jgi:hypothetical protein
MSRYKRQGRRAKLRMHDRTEKFNPAHEVKHDKGRKRRRGRRNRHVAKPPSSALGYEVEADNR